MSHSWPIGSGGNPKLAQILCGSPDLGDRGADAPVPPRATPPYPLDTFGGLRTNFSSINPSDRASVNTSIPEKKCDGSSARLGIRGLGVRVQEPVPVPVLIRAQVSVQARGRVRVEVRRTKFSTKCCPKFPEMNVLF